MVEGSCTSLHGLSQIEARTILEALKRGGVPTQHAALLAVGRDAWLSSVDEDLDFVSSGGSKSRLVVAPYGGGKSHFLSLVRHVALGRGFAVSHVELLSREAPFDKFETIFAKIMRELRVGDGAQGLGQVLEKWAAEFPYYSGEEIEGALRAMSRSLDFRSALRGYLDLASVSSPDSLQGRQDVLAWIQGDPLPAGVLRQLGIRNRVSILNVSEILSSFLEFLGMAGYSGFVLLLDEAEAITSLGQSRRRNEANQNLRKLLDNTDDNRGFYLLFSTTPRFMEDPDRGARSYPALWDRIRSVVTRQTGVSTKRALVMNLEPLGAEELAVLADNLVRIHGVGWAWPAGELFTEDWTSAYVRRYAQVNPDGPARPFLRTLIDLLDTGEQDGEGFDPEEAIGGLTFGEG